LKSKQNANNKSGGIYLNACSENVSTCFLGGWPALATARNLLTELKLTAGQESNYIVLWNAAKHNRGG
jgi:hypothetical protein